MKKRHLLGAALLCLTLLCLLGCTNTQPTDTPTATPTEIPTDTPTDTPTATPTAAPTLTVTPTPTTGIEDTARPVLVHPAYPTEDTVIADFVATDKAYAADATGKRDASTAIQSAIDACYNAGGGTVYLPAGQYLVKRQINIPTGVTLRGDWQDPDTAKTPTYGTVILAKPSKIKENASAEAGSLFVLNNNAAVMGLTVFYPDQNAESPLYYGYTFYCNSADTLTLRCLTLINAWRGIGISANAETGWHELAEISHIRMCALQKGFEMYHSSDVGCTTDVKISPAYWTSAAPAFACADAEAVKALCKKQAVGIILGDLDLEMLTEIAISGCQTGIRFVNPGGMRDGAFLGTIYDLYIRDCEYGLDVRAINAEYSALISRGEIEGAVCAIRNTQAGVPLRLCGITVNGTIKGSVTYDDSAVTEEGGLKSMVTRHGSYQKPAERLYTVNLTAVMGKKKDAAPLIQAVLDEAGKTGGVVYLSAGVYSLYTPLTVPAGVELAGISDGMNRDTSYSKNGTILLSYVADTATVSLGENAGVTGLRIWCPANDPTTALEKILADDACTAVPIIRGTGKGVYCTDTVLVAGYTGIDFRNCDNHYVKQVFGCCYLSFLTLGGKDGFAEECLANPNFTQRSYNLSGFFDTKYADLTRWAKHSDGEQQNASLPNYSAGFFLLCDTLLREHCVPFTVIDAENETLNNVFMYASFHVLSAKNSSVTVHNIGIDTLKGTHTMFVAENSRLLAVNILRIFGSSVSHDAASSVHLYNRVAKYNLKEEPYNTDR